MDDLWSWVTHSLVGPSISTGKYSFTSSSSLHFFQTFVVFTHCLVDSVLAVSTFCCSTCTCEMSILYNPELVTIIETAGRKKETQLLFLYSL